MYICQETRKPKHLSQIKGLLIDRSTEESDFSQLPPTVCISLNGTLFHKATPSDAEKLDNAWLKDAVSVESNEERHIVIPRPGALDLLLELEKHTCPMVYSSQTEEFIEAALLQLSISLYESNCFGNHDEYEKANAYIDHYVWSREQCIKGAKGYQKSLGTLSELSENGINDIWLIDHNTELVDFPSHVIKVSEFCGDPSDRELFRVADQIFIN